ncbi:AAA family ATPase [Rubrivirga sp. IMCC43871]|uniref:AAA family ATPase n=1 Tax=Rubrivirga sp. IMCC43871 TaxID=3391575 RepID=UPI00399005E6
MTNPFEFGRELSASEIVDRTDEVALVVRALHQRERLFVIGPRRFGKTSILRAATERAENQDTVVLRYNAEAFPSLTALAERLVADAAKRLTGPVKRAGERVQQAFATLRPQLSYNPHTDSFSASITAEAGRSEPTLIADALSGLDALAATAKGPVAVVIDEFQRVVEDGGVSAEGQIRAAVQAHDHLGYVFAGSQTRMLAEMTGDESRPFYRLGARLFVGPVPREDFRPALAAGFRDASLDISDEAVETILDLAEDVPYNVQRLAHEAWAEAVASGEPVTAAGVHVTLDRLVGRDDPFYTQTWNGLSRTQKQALLAVAREGGTGLYAGELLRAYDLASPSTMRTALQALTRAGVTREEEHQGSLRVRLEDPFFAAWLRLFVVAPS